MFGIQAPKKGFKPDFVTITEKNLSKKTKLFMTCLEIKVPKSTMIIQDKFWKNLK